MFDRGAGSLRIRRSVQRPPRDESSGAWYRLARSVMRRLLAYIAVLTIALLALGAPFLRISWGGIDARTLPREDSPAPVPVPAGVEG